jgi:NADH-quinone oxidoreductase subunit F
MSHSFDLLRYLEESLGISVGQTTPDGLFTLEETQCLGRCSEAPVMMVDDRIWERLSAKRAASIIDAIRSGRAAPAPVGRPRAVVSAVVSSAASSSAREHRVALRYLDIVAPLDLDAYVAAGGYRALEKTLGRDAASVVEELTRAILRGRGGAGFPAGLKGRAASDSGSESQRYIVCNADEGEPGTFKDRIIMEGEPHLLLEGILIAGYAIGASRGYIYVRGEYGLSLERLGKAVDDARGRGFLGSNILGSGFTFDIEIRPGAGSYLCGEELTLLESLEGKRGYPRIKPPYPAESGLWKMPTLVNNVETLANLPFIASEGSDAYLAMGTPSSPGTKIFCISGDVRRPGFVEVEMGIPLRSLIDDFAGGLKGGGPPLAVLLGGAAGTFVSAQMLDLPMDYDALKKAGATLGSGAVIVLGRQRSLPAMLSSIMDFFRHESCGKCIPCRVGTARLAERAAALEAMSPEDRRAALREMLTEAEMMEKTSLCPLGQSPVLPLRSALAHLPDVL